MIMTVLENRVCAAQENSALRETLIQEYTGFILAAASKTLGRFVDKEDDAFSVAMIAFNEAITKFRSEKGMFLSFAARVIRARLIDERRKLREKTVPFSSLAELGKDGEIMEFDVSDSKEILSETALEIYQLQEELARYGIRFAQLSGDAPKAQKTKDACVRVISHVLKNPQMVAEVKKQGTLPGKTIIDALGITKKLLERHRKYLLAVILILSGDYPVLSHYFDDIEPIA